MKGKHHFSAAKNPQSLAAQGVHLVDDTGLEFANYGFLLLFSFKYVTFSSEIIKFCTSQSSCFIRDVPLKGQNKGQTDRQRMECHATKISYTEHNGCPHLDLTLPKEEYTYGRLGKMRKAYLKGHHRGLYNVLLLSGKLESHLVDIDTRSNEMPGFLTTQITSVTSYHR